ncbi:MAG: type II secretion system protein [Lysinibacillus sp.]
MSEQGFSLVETLLSLVIVMVLCGTVLPISHIMKTTLHNKKLEMHATEAAYEGAKNIQGTGLHSGVQIIDGVQYEWQFDGHTICVQFQNTQERRQKCITKTGQII